MGIFDRLSTLIKSNLNDLISSAEDPEKMLNQIIVDMRNQLAKAKQQVAAAIADEKRLKDQADAEFKLADDWERRAMLAVQEGRDDLARQALMRGQEHLEHGQQLATTWEAHKLETEKLKQSLRDLNDKIEEAKRKKNLLLARQRRAEAQARQCARGADDKGPARTREQRQEEGARMKGMLCSRCAGARPEACCTESAHYVSGKSRPKPAVPGAVVQRTGSLSGPAVLWSSLARHG